MSIKKIYDTVILKYLLIVLLVLSIFVSILGYNSTKVEVDASAETLLLDDDKDLAFFREVNKRYDNSNFLIVTFKAAIKKTRSKILLATLNTKVAIVEPPN